MRNPVLPAVLLFIVFMGAGCSKSKTCSPKPVSSEAAEMQAFATANGITASVHGSGLYYQIITPGTGATPTINSRIAITYTGTLLDGTIFDQRTTPNNTQTTGPESPWAVNRLIEGWIVGIPLIKEGGRIKLIVPSAMAYGCTGYATIPGNTILYFDINLVTVQ